MTPETKVAPEAHSDQKPKLVTITFDGKPKEIEAGTYTVEKLRNALNVPHDEILAELIGDTYKTLLSPIDIKGGEVLAVMVEVTYNGNPLIIAAGKYTVEKLRETLKVPANDVLSQFIDGSFKDLTTGHVEVKARDVFASHVPQGGAANAD